VLLAAASENPGELLARHQAGDWGEVPPEDARENELAIIPGASASSAATTWARGTRGSGSSPRPTAPPRASCCPTSIDALDPRLLHPIRRTGVVSYASNANAAQDAK
jgi:hypothetical protein